MNQIEQIFPVTGRTHCTAVPLHAAWKKKANLQRGKERQLPKKSVESSRLYHQTCCRDEEEATGPPTATDGVLCLWYLASCLPGNACFCCRFWKCLERWGACSYWWDRKKAHPSHRWVVDSQGFHTGLPPPSDLLTGWNCGEQLTEAFILPSTLGLKACSPCCSTPGIKHQLKGFAATSCSSLPSSGSSSFRQGRRLLQKVISNLQPEMQIVLYNLFGSEVYHQFWEVYLNGFFISKRRTSNKSIWH